MATAAGGAIWGTIGDNRGDGGGARQAGLEKSKAFPVPPFKNVKLSVKVRKLSRQKFW